MHYIVELIAYCCSMANDSTAGRDGLTAWLPAQGSGARKSLRAADLGALRSRDRAVVDQLLSLPALDED